MNCNGTLKIFITIMKYFKINEILSLNNPQRVNITLNE